MQNLDIRLQNVWGGFESCSSCNFRKFQLMFWFIYLLSAFIVYIKFDFLFSLFLKDNPHINLLEEEKELIKFASITLPVFNTVLAIGGFFIKETK